MLTLGQAARLTGTSKTTLTRAIKAGRLSATRHDDGSYGIDPSDLARVYDIIHEIPATSSATGAVVHQATPPRDHGATPETPALQAEIEGLRAQLALMRDQLADVKDQRDGWRRQAETLLLQDQRPRRGWFGLRKAG